MLGAGDAPKIGLPINLSEDRRWYGRGVPKDPGVPFVPNLPTNKHEERRQRSPLGPIEISDGAPPNLDSDE